MPWRPHLQCHLDGSGGPLDIDLVGDGQGKVQARRDQHTLIVGE